jgi:hypothetical protein
MLLHAPQEKLAFTFTYKKDVSIVVDLDFVGHSYVGAPSCDPHPGRAAVVGMRQAAGSRQEAASASSSTQENRQYRTHDSLRSGASP